MKYNRKWKEKAKNRYQLSDIRFQKKIEGQKTNKAEGKEQRQK